MQALTMILARPLNSDLRHPAAVCDLGGNAPGLVIDGWRESAVGL